MMAAISAPRMARSDGLTSPASVAAMKIGTGPSHPANVRIVMAMAWTANRARMAHNTLRCPNLSPAIPNIGAISVPR